MAKACCVCGESTDKPDNLLFSCKGHGCDVVVHQACYGIVSIPGGQWFCRKCESQERAARVRCELCPQKEGALKRTDSGGWAHVVCALYIPEVTFLNNTKMEPIITSKLPRERFSKSCYICEQKGQESQAIHGACMSCHKTNCRMAFHVTCAQKERLLCEEEDARDQGSLVYCGYCANHYKKMIRQKHKQNLRKHVATPTSTMAPPLPSVSTPTTSQPSPLTSAPLPPPSFSAYPSPPPHKDLAESNSSIALTDHLGGQKGHQTSHPNQSNRPRNKDRERKDGPQKRISIDAPIPPAKRKNRRRKLSSSNESTSSEAPSNASDIGHASSHHHLEPTGAMPLRGGAGMESSSTEMLNVTSCSKQETSSVDSHPVSPITTLGGGRERENTSSRVQGPPLSLQELLERQWEQTAQYILDQAGRQNNAGVMLAHLHQLQSENRTMQSRIMELASQREFYIAINTRLRQTLADGGSNRFPNGLQPPSNSDSLPQSGGHPPSTSSPTFRSSSSGDKPNRDSFTPPASATSLSKQDQESLLHAHFLASSLPGGYQPAAASKPNALPSNAHPPSCLPQSTSQDSHQVSAHRHRQYDQTDYSSPILDNNSDAGRTAGSMYEITQVTNSVHTPLSSYVPIPPPDMDSLTREHPQSRQPH